VVGCPGARSVGLAALAEGVRVGIVDLHGCEGFASLPAWVPGFPWRLLLVPVRAMVGSFSSDDRRDPRLTHGSRFARPRRGHGSVGWREAETSRECGPQLFPCQRCEAVHCLDGVALDASRRYDCIMTAWRLWSLSGMFRTR
jgi:hypothetical protein